MNEIINILSDFLHIAKFIALCNLILRFPKRCQRNRISILVIIIAVASLVLGVTSINPSIKMILYIMLILGIYVYLYEERKGKLLLVSIWSTFMIAAFDIISKVIVITSAEVIGIRNNYIEEFSLHTITLAFIIITGILITRKYRNGFREIGSAYYIIYAVLAFVNTGVIMCLGDFAINKVIVERKTVFQLFFLAVAFGTLIQMIMVIFLLLSRNLYQEKEQLAAKYLNEQKKHYEYLESRERSTKKFRHDLHSHIYIIRTLYSNQENEKLEEYLSKLGGEIEKFGNSICVNNGIVDAILNKFADEAEKSGISLDVEGYFPTQCNISAFDLCTIFSNLLSNALEAEKKCKGHKIKVVCGYTIDQIAIYIENDIKEKILKQEGKFLTSKKDKINHGFGLENVKDCVERNQGEILIDNENNLFRVIIFLKKE